MDGRCDDGVGREDEAENNNSNKPHALHTCKRGSYARSTYVPRYETGVQIQQEYVQYFPAHQLYMPSSILCPHLMRRMRFHLFIFNARLVVRLAQ
jgi:hypothetical protein